MENDLIEWEPLLDRRAIDAVGAAIDDCTDEAVSTMVLCLARRCRLAAISARYALPVPPPYPSGYPVEEDGYAASFDPLEDERGHWTCWHRHGIVVGRGVVAPPALEAAANRPLELLATMGGENGSMPLDANGQPLASRGFLELYHDAVLADLRQSIRLYIHHVLIWGRADLWTSFDRMGLKLPGHATSEPLPLHVDQNPLLQPGFETIQGVLALRDCPAERGTFVGVPGSRSVFSHYAALSGRGDYVPAAEDFARHMARTATPLALRAGDVVTWDSRTTHANSANVSSQPRVVAYVAAGPARPGGEAEACRRSAFETGRGSNVRSALMHASMKPRYDSPDLALLRRPEVLTPLGRLLYGIERYPPGAQP